MVELALFLAGFFVGSFIFGWLYANERDKVKELTVLLNTRLGDIARKVK